VLQLPPAHPLQLEPEEESPPLLPPPVVLKAKVDICFVRSSLWQSGQYGLSLPIIRASNSLPQALQIKSYKGMARSQLCFQYDIVSRKGTPLPMNGQKA
jgi:hypothetical protein